MNRLEGAPSPYLRAHAGNPVDWWPFCDAAFAEAAARDVPVLLSVGYASCHWCHVMAHESFEDPATAALMNERFVNVKVDREERPDVDELYLRAVQLLTGQGGWPMTVFLLPDGRPFFGGTYFPPEDRHGLPGFRRVLLGIADAWEHRREEVVRQAERVTEALAAADRPSPRDRDPVPRSGPAAPVAADRLGPPPVGGVVPAAPRLLAEGVEAVLRLYDPRHGGFGAAPKFPQPGFLELLLVAHAWWGTPGALEAATTTLDAMASGGIYDHLGGGFARYSVDARFAVPHFEKMLYDQAQLARVYLHAWQLTGDGRYLQVLEETVDYVLRDLRHPDGGLCAAEDADSEGEEGRYYLWRPEELEEALGPELAAVAASWYGVRPEGNFEGGATVLSRPVRGDLLRPPRVEEARRRLLERRCRRVRPALDDQVLGEWNAMFLSSLAEAASATGRADWREAAVTLGAFLHEALRRPDGRYLRRPERDGPSPLAFASDYAWLVDAFGRLAELTGEAVYLSRAREAAQALLELFVDERDGTLFGTGRDAAGLVVRTKELADGSVPSASSTAALALARLGALAEDEAMLLAAARVLDGLAPLMTEHPAACPFALVALAHLAAGPIEVVVTGARDDLCDLVRRRYLPGTVLRWGEAAASLPPGGSAPKAPGDAAAFVCRRSACLAPALAREELEQRLAEAMAVLASEPLGWAR
jgi:uncharacterized protein YyaL (SSP411 family)